ncbi:probable LIM domain-containing serine/threonine-protein ki at C-terminar half [Coccomyxa sp. Obi]|nr:probable LIM domain-containing serine/threonine-protein ki at C-terminar half [Coccomyxa sp. Obi]
MNHSPTRLGPVRSRIPFQHFCDLDVALGRWNANQWATRSGNHRATRSHRSLTVKARSACARRPRKLGRFHRPSALEDRTSHRRQGAAVKLLHETPKAALMISEHRQQLWLLILLCLCPFLLGTQAQIRIVTNAKELENALLDDGVQNITIKGRVHLTKENWMTNTGGTAIIKPGRHVILQSDKDTPASAVLDLGALVDAIHVASGAHLELLRLHIPNSGNRKVRQPSKRVRLNVAGAFALWPSVTVAQDSQMSFGHCVFYYWSDEEWDSCDKFREVATPILNPNELPDLLEWRASDTQVYIKGRQHTTHRLINIVRRDVYEGTMRTIRTNHTLVCVPNIFHAENGSSWLMILSMSVVGSVLGAVAISHYFGFLGLTWNGPGRLLVDGSDGSGGSHRVSTSSGQPQNSVDHITWLVRERQRATIDGLELGELLGRGSFGRVYKGRWRGALVAVKVVAHDCSIASLAETLRESALSTSIQHPNVVTTFKVRTVRAKRDIESLASRWAQGSDNNLDEAAGGCQQLLARALSSNAARQQAKDEQQLQRRCDSAIAPQGHLRSFSLDVARWPNLTKRMFWRRSGGSEGASADNSTGRTLRPTLSRGIVGTPVIVLDSEREAAIALAHGKSPELSPELGFGSPRAALAQPLVEGQEEDKEERFNFMPPSDQRTVTDHGEAGPLGEGAWVEGGSSGPKQAMTRALPPRSGSAPAAYDAHNAQAGVRASDAPAKVAAALQAWHEAAHPQSPPPERLTPANDSASERERQRGLQQQPMRSQIELLETWLILEYCDHGSFDNAIRAGKYMSDLTNGILCLMDVAAGMEHLHSLGVLHADLKGANVLLKSAAMSNYDQRGYMCKLADFGLSRVMENNSTHVSTTTFGTAAYMPAEMLMEGKMTKAADVYSFGMLMWEVLTGKKVFEGLRQSQIICKVMTGWRPEVPEGCPSGYTDIMVACWHANPAQRPGFADILQRLRGICRDMRLAGL